MVKLKKIQVLHWIKNIRKKRKKWLIIWKNTFYSIFHSSLISLLFVRVVVACSNAMKAECFFPRGYCNFLPIYFLDWWLRGRDKKNWGKLMTIICSFTRRSNAPNILEPSLPIFVFTRFPGLTLL